VAVARAVCAQLPSRVLICWLQADRLLCAMGACFCAMGACFGCRNSDHSAKKHELVGTVKKYRGYREHAYRLLFPYEKKFPEKAPDLLTILPTGVIETTKNLEAENERGLLAYPYPQCVEASVAQKVVHTADSQWKDKQYAETPFIDESGGKYRLVQTWPTKFNDKFKQEFKCNETNADPKLFEPAAVEAFEACIESLFGTDATHKCRIQFCHKVTENNFPCYVGLTESLIMYLKQNRQEMRDVGIKKMTSDGFVAKQIDGKGKKGEKTFKMESNTQYVIYKKVGWTTMGCCKPLEQFLKESEFFER